MIKSSSNIMWGSSGIGGNKSDLTASKNAENEAKKFVVRERDEDELIKAKQRASFKWLLSKAYNNDTPAELKSPFYKDHQNVERLKPHIVHSLANAELYCMALANLYADPNFHNLNHWGIIQALARKGVLVAEPADCSLTETVLIQTNPLKLSAHMAMTEAIMSLHLKETVRPDKLSASMSRLCNEVDGYKPSRDEEGVDATSDMENGEALVAWVNRCCDILKAKSEKEMDSEPKSNTPKFPTIKEFSDLSDGVGLACVIALYAPSELPWSEVALGDPPSMADSLYNIQLLQRLCAKALPYDVCHVSIEDIVYLHPSIKKNVVCLLADLYETLELRGPVIRGGRLPGVKRNQVIEVPDPGSENNSDFVVQRGKAVPTLSSLNNLKESLNKDSKSVELGEADPPPPTQSSSDLLDRLKTIPAAGKTSTSDQVGFTGGGRRASAQTAPTSNEQQDLSTPSSGRRRVSRRNSIVEDSNASQLSIENLGGSTDNLYSGFLARNPDKEMKTHSGRRTLPDQPSEHLQHLDNREVEEKHQRETIGSSSSGEKVSFADLRKQKARDQFHTSGININYGDDNNEKPEPPPKPRSSVRLLRSDSTGSNLGAENSSSSTTGGQVSPATAKQQQDLDNSLTKLVSSGGEDPDAMAAQLNNVRLKLEQRRKRIEEEKKKMESIMSRQREKNFSEDLSAVQSKWLSGDRNRDSGGGAGGMGQDPRTPDIEGMDMDAYTKRLTAMDDSLSDLQSDIQRLASQQSQIQNIMHHPQQQQQSQQQHPMDPQPFYMSQGENGGHPGQQQRRMWGQPQPISFATMGGAGVSRTSWGGPRPPMPPYGQQGPYGGPQGPYNDPYYQQRDGGYNMYGGGPDPYHQQMGSPHHNPYNYPPYSSPSGGPPPPNYYGQPHPQNPQGPYGPSPPQQQQQNYQSQSRAGPQPFRLHDPPQQPGGQQFPGMPHRPNSYQQQGQGPNALSSPIRRQSYYDQSPSTAVATPTSPPVQQQPQPPKMHTGLPAPPPDDMAPQNVSFIETEDDDEPSTPTNEPMIPKAKSDATSDSSAANDPLKRLPERLSQLNISSGSKTYRVHHSSDREDITSPSPTGTGGRTRPSISSTFKQQRKGSGGETSGPSSLRSNGAAVEKPPMTEEEAETLATMKTERLKDDADASKGFVISFDDDERPKKPKPSLKPRRPSSASTSGNRRSIGGMPTGGSELGMGSDGSNSSRKENVPPEVMICIDMNMGSDEGESVIAPSTTSSGFGGGRKYPPPTAMTIGGRTRVSIGGGSNPTPSSSDPRGLTSPTRSIDWRSYGAKSGTEDDDEDAGIPKFDVDPNVPLEKMVSIGGNGSEEGGSESDGGPAFGKDKQKALIIGKDMVEGIDPTTQDEMQKKKERIIMQSLRRKQQVEEKRIRAEEEARRRREEEARKEEEKQMKKEEEKARKEAILEQHRLKKEMEKAQEEGRYMPKPVSARPVPKLRSGSTTGRATNRPRPKTIHVDQDADVGMAYSRPGLRGSSTNVSGLTRADSRDSINSNSYSVHHAGGQGRSSNLSSRPPRPSNAPASSGLSLAGMGSGIPQRRYLASTSSSRPGSRRGSNVNLADERQYGLPPAGNLTQADKTGTYTKKQSSSTGGLRRKTSSASATGQSPYLSQAQSSPDSPRSSRYDRNLRSVSQPRGKRDSSVSSVYGARDYRGSRESLNSGITYTAASHGAGGRRGSNASFYDDDYNYYGGSMRDLSNRPAGRRKSSSASHIGPGSLPGYRQRRGVGGTGGEYDDGASDISSTSGFSAFGYRNGTRLYREPSAKSNRTIILNAIEYVVFPGEVNRDTRERVLDIIDRCDCPHFLLLFRDQKCQFRGLYAYYPDTEEVYKIYGTGPKQVTANMFEFFFKYNSGGKKFTKIHTKSLTVTIDAFTIHNQLWLGKKAKLPVKKDMALVI